MTHNQPIGHATSHNKWIFLYLLLFYIIFCFVIFFIYVKPSLDGQDNLRIGADSSTYFEAAESIDSGNVISSSPALISFQGQYLGPVLVASICRTTLNIAFFNTFLFIIGLWYASRLPGLRIGLFLFLITINPITTVSILTLNKEILAYLSVILFVRYIHSTKRTKAMLTVILLISIAARWEQAAIILLFLTVEHRWSPLKRRRWTAIFIMIGCITIVWPLLVSSGVIQLASLLTTAKEAQSQSLPWLNKIQDSYGFPVVLIPKIVGNMFGIPWKIAINLLHTYSFIDIQDQLVSPLQNLLMLLIFIVAMLKGKLRLQSGAIYWMWLYLIMTAAGPIFQPRYEYPVYVLLCLEICGLISPVYPGHAYKPVLAGFWKRLRYIPAP